MEVRQKILDKNPMAHKDKSFVIEGHDMQF